MEEGGSRLRKEIIEQIHIVRAARQRYTIRTIFTVLALIAVIGLAVWFGVRRSTAPAPQNNEVVTLAPIPTASPEPFDFRALIAFDGPSDWKKAPVIRKFTR